MTQFAPVGDDLTLMKLPQRKMVRLHETILQMKWECCHQTGMSQPCKTQFDMGKYDVIYCACPGPDLQRTDQINDVLLPDLSGYNAGAVMLKRTAEDVSVVFSSAD